MGGQRTGTAELTRSWSCGWPASSGWILAVKLRNLFERQMIIHRGTSHLSNHSSEFDSDLYLIVLVFQNIHEQTTFNTEFWFQLSHSATSVEDICTRVWSSSRESSSLLPARCNNTKLLRLFRLGSSGQGCNCDSKTIQTAIPSCFEPSTCFEPWLAFTFQHSLYTLNRQLTSLTFNWETHLQKKWYVNDHNQILILEQQAPTLLLHWKTSDSLALPYLVDGQSLAHYLWVGLSWYWVQKRLRRDKRDGDIT